MSLTMCKENASLNSNCWYAHFLIALYEGILKKKERLKRQKIVKKAFVLSFKWLCQSLALVGSDKEMRKKQIREVETLSNHYPMETP